MPIAAGRDAVLLRFQSAHPRPRAVDIEDWVARHPEHADDIRGHAELMLAAHQDGLEEEEPSLALVARGRDRALARLGAARAAAIAPPGPDLAALLAAADATVPGLAALLDVGRPTLTDLVRGRVAPPVGERLLAELAGALGTTMEAVRSAVALSAGTPRLGLARARTPSAVPARPYADAVRDDPTMTDAREAFWLSGG